METVALMSLNELQVTLAQRKIRLWVEDGQLRFQAPQGSMDTGLRDALKAHKPALLEMLSISAKPGVLKVDPEARYHPFPLTDLQQAYWVGEHGGYAQSAIPCYVNHVEFANLSVDMVQKAFDQLQRSHEVLRTRFNDDATQQILPQGDARVALQYHDLRALSQREAEARCAELVDSFPETLLPDLQEGPPLAAALLHLPHGDRLILALRLIVLDGPSMARLFHDLLAALSGQTLSPPSQLSYRDYVLALCEQDRSAAEAYWSATLPSLPDAPQLPLTGASPKQSKFIRMAGRLGIDDWSRLKHTAQVHGITPNAMMLALYAAVLRVWAEEKSFTLNVLTSYRPFEHPELGQIVGNHSNTILTTCSGQGSFVDQARDVQVMLAERLSHASVSGVSLLRRLQQIRQADRPAVPFVFTSGISQQAAKGLPQVLRNSFRPVSGQLRTPQVWLDNQVVEDQDGLLYHWDYVDGIFENGLPEALFERFESSLAELLDNESAWLSTNPAVPQTVELAPLAPVHEAPMVDSLGSGFLSQVARSPDAIALISADGKQTSYRELADKALRLAQGLVSAGVCEGDLVAVSLPKGLQQIISVIGISLAGAAWLPMDIRLPAARRTAIVQQSGVQYIIGDGMNALRPRALLRNDPLKQPRGCGGNALAYVIYTSGSTGQPKGVATAHGAVLNTLFEINRRFSIGSQDRVLALSALNFDLSVYDIWGTLICGATIIVPPDAQVPDPSVILEQCKRDQVTVWNSVPALLEMAFLQGIDKAKGALCKLNVIMLSGDWISLSLAQQVLDDLPQTEFYSLGGATEASIWSNYYPITQIASDWRSIPYGYGLAGQQLHVLDKYGDPCLPWLAGQIYIEGRGLAQGYYNDFERTSASFITHKSGRRLYATGDLGRVRSDGAIEFLGRLDFQLKLFGHRIEAGDVESHLLAQDAIKSAVVTVVRSNTGQPVLVAQCTGKSFDTNEVRDALQRELPSYMVPTHIFQLDALPLSANGKRDHKALRKLAEQALVSVSSGEKQADEICLVEEELEPLVTLWGDITGARPSGPQAHFFQEGGTSMLAVQLIAAISREFGVTLPLATLFENPTLGAVWRAVETSRSEIIE